MKVSSQHAFTKPREADRFLLCLPAVSTSIIISNPSLAHPAEHPIAIKDSFFAVLTEALSPVAACGYFDIF